MNFDTDYYKHRFEPTHTQMNCSYNSEGRDIQPQAMVNMRKQTFYRLNEKIITIIIVQALAVKKKNKKK